MMCILLSFAVGFSLKDSPLLHKNPQADVNVFVFKETPYGKDLIATGNLVTDEGDRYVRNILGFNNVTAPTHNATKWIALGNSTIVATNTILDAEATTTGFTRFLGTVTPWINAGDWSYNVTNKFTATGNIQINSTSLHWSDISNTDNNCFAMASLGGAQDFQNNWNCTIVWVITWQH